MTWPWTLDPRSDWSTGCDPVPSGKGGSSNHPFPFEPDPIFRSQGKAPSDRFPFPRGEGSGIHSPRLGPFRHVRSRQRRERSDERERKRRREAEGRLESIHGNEMERADASKTLAKASKTRAVPPQRVYETMRALEKMRIQPTDAYQIMAGTRSPGRAWRLVFTSSAKQIRDEMRGKSKGGGLYFPLVAGQQWDPERQVMRNGVFLGHYASMVFEGPTEERGTKMRFDFHRLTLKLGPWKKTFQIKATPKDEPKGVDPKLGPFFVRCYVDDEIMVMRGKGGGIALWARADEEDVKQGLIFG